MLNLSCPICEKPMPGELRDWPFAPFCSKRCKTIDLGRWLGERYAVEAEEQDDGSVEDADGP